MTKTITFYKTWAGWSFDDSATDTWGEPMINGSETAMDYWFEDVSGAEPGPMSHITATISEEAGGHTFMMTKTGQTMGGTEYKDTEDWIWWLCPWLEKAFGSAPSYLFVTINNVDSD